MAQTFKWVAPEAIATALDVQLNALANTTLSAVSAVIPNETDLYQFMNLEVVLASLTPTTAFLAVLLLPRLDATNYADANINDLDRICASIIVDTATGAKRVMKENIAIPPLDFKLALYNSTGVALNAAGNTLKYRRHNGQGV